jgi:hypothetical protein
MSFVVQMRPRLPWDATAHCFPMSCFHYGEEDPFDLAWDIWLRPLIALISRSMRRTTITDGIKLGFLRLDSCITMEIDFTLVQYRLLIPVARRCEEVRCEEVNNEEHLRRIEF